MTTTFKNMFAALGGAVIAVGLILSANMVSAHSDTAKTSGALMKKTGTEVSLSDNGRTLVRGAEVTDVGNNTITARTVWGNTAITWTVATNGDTDFVRQNGKDATLGDIDEGDTISFSGAIDQSAGAFTVTADAVRNWSLADTSDTYAVFSGKVTAVDDNADTFRVATAEGTAIVVRTNDDTAYAGKNQGFVDVDVNDGITVSGTYNSDTKVLTASRVSLSGAIAATAKGKFFNWGHFWGSWGMGHKNK